MDITIKEVQARSILTPQKMGSLANSYDFSLNPYGGCAFKCSYCYVPKFPNGKHEPSEWGTWLEVKTNAPELIREARLKVFGSRIFFSSATDPYQYIELKYRLSRRCLKELILYQPARVTMHTRSHLLIEDIELLKAFGKRLAVGVSFTTNDDGVREEFEPQAPSIKRRIELIRKLNEAGINVYASISPLLPCEPDTLVRMLKPHVNKAWVDQMNWLDVMQKPQLLEKYKDFFAEQNYAAITKHISREFAAAWAS